VSIEGKLEQLAREREGRTDGALIEMLLEPPDVVRRELRDYLSRQVDHGRMKRTIERFPQLATIAGGLNELACPEAQFSSGARLQFNVQLEEKQRGWLVRRFRFHVFLPQTRSVNTVLIHLNAETGRHPLVVPRCHMHVGGSQAHVPFPVMDPRLILYFICDHVEPDFGA
jgi:hypothetical protein